MELQCTQCKRTFTTIKGLKIHLTKSHEIKSLNKIIIDPLHYELINDSDEDEVFGGYLNLIPKITRIKDDEFKAKL